MNANPMIVPAVPSVMPIAMHTSIRTSSSAVICRGSRALKRRPRTRKRNVK